MERERREMKDHPWSHSVRLALEANEQTGRLISCLISQEKDDVDEAISVLKSSAATSNSSTRMIYVKLNPDFTVHDLCSTRKFLNDLQRTSLTKLRVCGQNLNVETGR